MNEIALIQSLIEELNQLEYGNKSKLDEFLKNGEMMIGSIFGEDDEYVLDFQNIQFLTSNKNADQIEKRQKWLLGSSKMMELIKAIQEDLKLFEIATIDATTPKIQKESKKQVFIVHGQDDMMLQLVSRTLKELRINPLILSKHPNKKKSIINDFNAYSVDSFAIVLLSPDDN